MSITPELQEFITEIVEEKVREIMVRREELDRLASALKELNEAEARADEALTKLEAAVENLVRPKPEPRRD